MSNIIILTGVAGSGKTTQAKEMAKKYKNPFFQDGLIRWHEMPSQTDVVIIDSVSSNELLSLMGSLLFENIDYIIVCQELPFKIVEL